MITFKEFLTQRNSHIEEDWTDAYQDDKIDKTLNDERDADALMKHLKGRGFKWTQKLSVNGRFRVRGIKDGISIPKDSTSESLGMQDSQLSEIKKASVHYFDITKVPKKELKPGEYHWSGGKIHSIQKDEHDWEKAVRKKHGKIQKHSDPYLGTIARKDNKDVGLWFKDTGYVFENLNPRD